MRIVDHLADKFDELRYRFGEILAGFNVFAHLTVILSFGNFADWLSQHYLAFSRWCWDKLFAMVPYFHIALPKSDKDALTAALFFLPFFVQALRAEDQNHYDYNKAETTYQVAAALAISAGVLFIISGSTFADIWYGAWHFVLARWRVFGPLIVLLLFTGVPTIMYSKPFGQTNVWWVTFCGVMTWLLFTGLSFWAVFGIGATVYAHGGIIRGVVASLLVLLLYMTSVVHPKMVLRLGMWTFILVISGVLWHGILIVQKAVESVGSN